MNSRTSQQEPIHLFTTVTVGVLVVSLFSISLFSYLAWALPEGPVLTYYGNSTKVASAPDVHIGQKGTINYLTLTATQQNLRWKAYMGNVTGTLVLQDGDGFNIYDWVLTATISGTVLASRNDSVNWTDLECVSNATVTTEQEALQFASTSADNINSTFNSSVHSAITVNSIALSGCRTVYTFTNNTRQPYDDSGNLFQEIMIEDDSANVVYVTPIEQNAVSYNNATADFQLLLPDFGNLAVTEIVTYYFYVELT